MYRPIISLDIKIYEQCLNSQYMYREVLQMSQQSAHTEDIVHDLMKGGREGGRGGGREGDRESIRRRRAGWSGGGERRSQARSSTDRKCIKKVSFDNSDEPAERENGHETNPIIDTPRKIFRLLKV